MSNQKIINQNAEQTKEAVAYKLMKYIIEGTMESQSKDSILKLYRECLWCTWNDKKPEGHAK